MKVLAIIPGRGKQGAMPFVLEQCDWLERNGVEVLRFWIQGGCDPISALRDLVELRRVIKTWNPQIVHSHFGTLTGFLGVLAKQGRPLVVTFRGCDILTSKYDGFFRNLGQRMLSFVAACLSDCVVAVSEEIARNVWFRNSTVIPSGIDLNFFVPIKKVLARETLGWRNEEKVLLFYASDPRKRLDLAESILCSVKSKYPDSRLEIVKGGISRDGMRLRMSGSDLLLLLSDQEGSPNVVREANACNLPVVAVDVGDVRAQLFGVNIGGVFERNIDILSHEVEKVLAENRRSNGRELVEKYSQDILYPKLIDLYARLV